MKINVNGVCRDMTETEIEAMKAEAEKAELEHWQNISYEEAVNEEIRKRYSESQEFAILRQKDEKPDEYASYYAYCESCKAYVKSKKNLS